MTRVVREALSEKMLLLCQKRKINKEINIVRHNGRNDIVPTHVILYVSTWSPSVPTHRGHFHMGRRDTRCFWKTRLCMINNNKTLLYIVIIIITYTTYVRRNIVYIEEIEFLRKVYAIRPPTCRYE